MSPLLRIRFETRKVLERSFTFWSENFRSKNYAKLFFLWNVNNFKHNFLRNVQSKSLKTDEILVYEHNNNKFIKRLKIMSAAQYVVWALWGISSYDIARQNYLKVRESDKKEDMQIARQMKLVMKLMAISCIIGTVIIVSIWVFIWRTVKSIKLNKSNRRIIFETYTPFLKSRQFHVPFQNVSGVKSRISSKAYVPLKIKNKFFYYLVDVKGNFKDEVIFDSVVSLSRDLKDEASD